MSVNQDYAAGGSAPPPEGMPPEGAPPEAGPTPEGNMAAMEDERMRQMEAIAQMQEPMGEEEEEAPAEGEAPPAGTEGEGAEMTEDDEALMAEM